MLPRREGQNFFNTFGFMLTTFQNQLREQFPYIHESRLLLAVSGGLDSVVLTYLCKQSNLNISLAHCNFKLRGKESDQDETFVTNIAASLNLKVFSKKFDTENYAKENRCSIQVAARELRYNWFEKLLRDESFDFVLTAHHANDDLETFFINFLRGTGLDGLTGIPSRNGYILRPLLSFSRTQLENFAKESNMAWREDSSNATDKYKRNKIRHEIVPILEAMNPQLLDTFKKNQKHLQQSARLVEEYTAAIFSRLAQKNKYGYSLNIKLLKTVPNTQAILYELFKTFGFTEWEDIFHLLDAQSGKMVFSKTHRLIKDRESLLLTTIPDKENATYEISAGEEVAMLPIGTFYFEIVAEIQKEKDAISVFIDQEKIKEPLCLRKRKKGDIFYPSGMKGKKKLSKFFKDKKLSLPEKENCWLLCSGNEVVWVVGYRVDRRFEADNRTPKILKITFVP